jgi:hypothetical protein
VLNVRQRGGEFLRGKPVALVGPAQADADDPPISALFGQHILSVERAMRAEERAEPEMDDARRVRGRSQSRFWR